MNNDDRIVRYALGKKFHNARSQARHRGEFWDISREDFVDLWMEDNRWQRQGRGSTDLSLTRVDNQLDWTLDNVEIVQRSEIVQRPRK